MNYSAASSSSNALPIILDMLDLDSKVQQQNIKDFVEPSKLVNTDKKKRLASALQILISLILEEEMPQALVDGMLIDSYIAKLDCLLSRQMDEILHHPEFQEIESLWKGLAYVVQRTDFNANIKFDILDVSKAKLQEEFAETLDIRQTGIYHHVYMNEYDMPGGEPFATMISPYSINHSQQDIYFLEQMAKVSSSSHCPFFACVNTDFFGKESVEELTKVENLDLLMKKADYIYWRSFRKKEVARYIGLTFPKFLLRPLYGQQQKNRYFIYNEKAKYKDYLWGPATFAFAVNLSQSFKEYGWCVNIRGPESGGAVKRLPILQYNVGSQLHFQIPTEGLISESFELQLAKQGFISLCYYKNQDYACFFSANSVQEPAQYDSVQATANSRINARLPYIFLSSRIAHYLKVLQRESIGSNKNSRELEQALNQWLKSLVTKMNNPSPELSATHPLQEGKVVVEEIEDEPGMFRVSLHAVPHFQIEGMAVMLSLISKMPGRE